MVIELKILKWFKLLGITIFPFVFVQDISDEVTVNHEKIHLRQQLECLIVFFYLIYFIELIFKGYENISFEKEAYRNELDLGYLNKRRPYSWLINKKQ